eukprot:g42653.t1
MSSVEKTSTMAHVEGLGAVAISPDGASVYTCGSDGNLLTFGAADWSRTDFDLYHQAGGINTLAISPRGDLIATASADHQVALFTTKERKFDGLLTRFTGEALAVAFHPNQLNVAASGEDELVKIVNLSDTSQVKLLKGFKGSVKSLAYDPKGSYLATADTQGMLKVFDTTDWNVQLSIPCFPLPKVDAKEENQRLGMAWSPDGALLACPGYSQVSLLERGSWKPKVHLKNAHTKPVSLLAFSPNGKYLLSSGQDQKLVVWDMSSKEPVGDRVAVDTVVSIVWCPEDNRIFYLDREGNLHSWKDAVPSHLAAPFEKDAPPAAADSSAAAADTSSADSAKDASAATSTNIEKDGKTDDASKPLENTDAEKDKPLASLEGLVSNMDSDDEREEARAKEKERKADNSDEDEEEEAIVRRRRLKRSDKQEKSSAPAAAALSGTEGAALDTAAVSADASAALVPGTNMQPPFQPGCTPWKQKRCYLAWNHVGSAVARQEDHFHAIEISFSDASKGKPVRLRDHYQFTMCALGERAAFFASPENTDINRAEDPNRPSTVFYRPFRSWGGKSEWTLHLPKGESAQAVGCGGTWAALATNKQMLRIFSHSGIQKAILSLPGPVVSMTGETRLLGIVYHRGAPFAGSQNLGLWILDMEVQKTVFDTALPLSPKSTLKWIAFAENGMLMSMDSKGMVRGLISSKNWQRHWIPLLDTRAIKSQGSYSYYWPIGLLEGSLMCIICKNGAKSPTTLPKPIISTVELRIPFIGLDNNSVLLEEQHLRQSMMIHENVMGGKEPSTQELAALDKILLHLIRAACQADRGVRALDLCQGLMYKKSFLIAATVASNMKKTNLAQRISVVQQARFAKRAPAARPFASQSSSSPSSSSSSAFSSKSSSEPPPLSSPADPNFDMDEQDTVKTEDEATSSSSSAASSSPASSAPPAAIFNKAAPKKRKGLKTASPFGSNLKKQKTNAANEETDENKGHLSDTSASPGKAAVNPFAKKAVAVKTEEED